MTDRPSTITVPLNEPVIIGEGDKAKTYTELTFRRAKGRDLLMMDKVQGNTAKSYALYASMAGVPYKVFEEMDADDVQRVMLEAAGMVGNSAKVAVQAAMIGAAKDLSPE